MEYWRNLILSLGYISCIWSLHFRIYETYPCLLACFCLFGWEVAVWILVEIFMRDLFPHLHQFIISIHIYLINLTKHFLHIQFTLIHKPSKMLLHTTQQWSIIIIRHLTLLLLLRLLLLLLLFDTQPQLTLNIPSSHHSIHH